MERWNKLVSSGAIDKEKVATLKGFCKEKGLSQTGEKVSALGSAERVWRSLGYACRKSMATRHWYTYGI
jgi:hypothetical protein